MRKNQIKAALRQLDSLPLPEKEKLLSACPEPPPQKEPPEALPRRTFKRRPAVAVCAAAVLLLCAFSGYSFFAEAREYQEAVSFFAENDLPTEGLSRDDIKQVYRDIITNRFSYDKTAKVIEQSVGGYEIFQEEPTPEDLEKLWKDKNADGSGLYQTQNTKKGRNGVSYQFDCTERFDEALGYCVFDKGTIKQSVEGRDVWKVELPGFLIENITIADEQILLYGQNPEQLSEARLALLDTEGNVLWNKTVSNGFRMEFIESALFGDGEIVAFSRGDLDTLCVSKYDYAGNAKSVVKHETGNYGIRNTARLGDGYIVQLHNQMTGEYFVTIDADGAMSDSFVYTGEEEAYFITGMMEYNGNVYLSAYSVPKLDEGESNAGGRYDIAAILNELADSFSAGISNEALTQRVREHYTAVLLVCNPDSGEPQEFFSVNGSLG